jgi:hypothetical protein
MHLLAGEQVRRGTLVPLVFLILPTTIAFAIFPATLVLRMGL